MENNTSQPTAALLSGLVVVPPRRFSDSRGFFTELYNEFHPDTPEQLRGKAAQVNISFSERGVIRGMHFQTSPPQGKLLKLIQGKAIFVELDIKWGSPTFGQAQKIILSANDDEYPDTLWVPYGFANGFQALEPTILAYVCSGAYNKDTEKGISPFSPEVKSLWDEIRDENGKIIKNLSEKDQKSPFFEDLLPFLAKIDNF